MTGERSNEEIRADLNAFFNRTEEANLNWRYEADAASRLCRDVEPLLDALAAVRVERDALRKAVDLIGEWAYARHGGIKTPAEVWPGLAIALEAVGAIPETREPPCGNCGEPYPGEHQFASSPDVAREIICPRHTASNSTTETHDGFIAQCDRCGPVSGTPEKPA